MENLDVELRKYLSARSSPAEKFIYFIHPLSLLPLDTKSKTKLDVHGDEYFIVPQLACGTPSSAPNRRRLFEKICAFYEPGIARISEKSGCYSTFATGDTSKIINGSLHYLYFLGEKYCSGRSDKSSPIYIFTDGSARANGTVQCTSRWARVLLDFSTGRIDVETGTPQASQSNNRAELCAILAALEDVSEESGRDIFIISDSKYAIGVITQWYSNWIRRNNLSKKKNLDIIERIMAAFDYASKKNKIEFKHIRAHTNIINPDDDRFLWLGNYLADYYAAPESFVI